MPPRKASTTPKGRASSASAKKSARPSSVQKTVASPNNTKATTKASTTTTTTTSASTNAAKRLVQSISMTRDEPFSSLNPSVNEVVPPSALKNLKNYKYATIDNSILQKYCGIHKYWDFVVSYVPYWVAPNM